MANTTSPTILVKKSDGTFARMSLDEIKKKKAVGMTKNDTKSLLEEDAPAGIGAPVALRRESEVDAVIKKLTFAVPPNFVNRLRSAVQLRLKDVRGEKETRATVLRSIKDGGLGLTEAQAVELEKFCVAVGNLGARDFKKDKKNVLMAEGQILPQMFAKPSLPAKTTPFNAFVHEEFLKKNADKEIKKEEKFQISPPSLSRPIMKDVVEKSSPVGPVEEIKFFTLIDFRRLSQDPAQASKRLAQKFINLKDESVLLFWQAIDAWRQSPLFSDYVGVLNQAITGQKPAQIDGNSVGIASSEIEALIKMEKDLGI